MIEFALNATIEPVTALVTATNNESFPWLSASILFPIIGSFLVPFIPDKGDGKQVRWFALAIALLTFLITIGAYWKGYEPAQEGLQLAERVDWLPSLGLAWSVGADG